MERSDGMRKIKGYGVGERAVIGRLRRLGGKHSCFGEIAVYDRTVDVADILALPDDISGILVIGERTDTVGVAVKARGISAVFISREDADGLADGERAVIYPERDTVFIAPKIEIVDDFSTRMRAEIEEDPKEKVRLWDCREHFSGKIGMMAMLADKDVLGEEHAFERYKIAAEECELKKLLILFDTSCFDTEIFRSHIKGIIRAAIYTKIALAVSVKSIDEYEKIISLIKGVCCTLRKSGCEIPEDICCGVVINNASVAVCTEEYSRAADVVVIDSKELLCGVCSEERELAFCGYLDVIFERMSGHVRDVVILGDKQLLEKCMQRICTAYTEPTRSYFLMENKNIK